MTTKFDEIREMLMKENKGWRENPKCPTYRNGNEMTEFLMEDGDIFRISEEQMPDEEHLEDWKDEGK